ncbi:MAG: hypothetical protein HOK04_13360, partial [Verrucomicrobia bacterium]|nr:hypothetical protein [Verrucomicrobiota bacterium]
LAGLVLVDSHREPYRMNELGQQTEAIAIRDFGNSQLLVDSGNRDRLTEIFTLMDQSDFVPETPLIGLTWRWNAAIPYALGARVPSSAMVTLFGYPGSLQLADENLNRQGDDFPWDEAWLMVDEPPSLEPERVGMVQEVIELLELRSGLSFPSDYIFVGVADDIQVYRPDF